MKQIFLRPIGTLRDLGTRREWIGDLIAVAAVLTLAVTAWLIL